MSKRANGEGSVFRYRDGFAAQITFKDGLGRARRKTVYGKTQAEAIAKKRKLERSLFAGVAPTAGRSPKVKQLLESWITQTLPARVQLGQLSPSTLDSYVDLTRRHIIPSLGHIPAAQLTPPQIRSWLTEKSNELSARKRPLSPRTVQLLHAVLRKALADAHRDGLVERNVALLVEAPRAHSPKVQPLTVDEARKILAKAVDDPLRLVWLTLLATGLRRGECLALRWEDIDIEGQTVHIRRSLQRLRGEKNEVTGRHRGRLVEKTPKTAASTRKLALPAFLTVELRNHRTSQSKARLASLAWADPGLVFTSSLGTPLEPRNVSRSWTSLVTAAGIGRTVRLHDLRHAAASFLLLQGADMRVVMDQLGHSRMATTSDLYTHVLEEVRRDAAERMNSLMGLIEQSSSKG